ncbi:MAG: hypothetical protein GX546_02140 [Acholeplasmataceae bacterium]|jgi:hypothetical protein|nr:hypothetical protein [Acholeplasmataceae bacterium]
MMSQVRKNKKSFSGFIIKYRKIIFLSLFFILLPIALVIGLYSGTKANGEKIKLSEEAEVISASKFHDVKNFTQFELNIEYTRLSDYYDPENPENKIGNRYTFNVSYNKKIQEVSNVTITTALVAPWTTYQEFKAPLKLTEGRLHTIQYEFKKIFPYKPLLFVEIKNPMLYFELKYTIAGLEHTEYLKYDLNTAKNVVVS